MFFFEEVKGILKCGKRGGTRGKKDFVCAGEPKNKPLFVSL